MRAERDILKTMLDEVQVERNGLLSNLKEAHVAITAIQSERDQIRDELHKAYNSKSFRITKPLRELAWFFRRLPGNYKKAKYSTRISVFSAIHSLRMLPLLSPLSDVIKRRYPQLWSRVRNKMLNTQMRTQNAEHPNSVVSPQELSDDYNTLTIRERQIYYDLINAVNQKKRG
jgi:hypothetical protein